MDSLFLMRMYYTLRVTVEDHSKMAHFKLPSLKGKKKVFIAHYNNHQTLPPKVIYKPNILNEEQ